MEEESWRRNHQGGTQEAIWEASGGHLGGIWETSGRHLGGIWEAQGSQEAPGGLEHKK